MKKDSEEKKRALWYDFEQETGYPFTHPEMAEFREIAEARCQGHDPDIDLEDLAHDIREWLRLYASFSYVPIPNPDKLKEKPAGVHGPYQKPLQKRLYLVNFVLRKHINLNNLIDRDISKRERIRWKELVRDWNMANPSDPMTNKTLKHAFYRSIKQPEIQEAFWGKLDDDMRQAFAPLFNQANSALQRMSSMMLKIANVLSPDDVKLLREYELGLQDTVDMLTPTEQSKEGMNNANKGKN